MASRKQKNVNTGGKKTLPVFLLAGFMFLLAVVLEGIYLFTEEFPQQTTQIKKIPKIKRSASSSNVFDNLYKKYPSYKTDKRSTKEIVAPPKNLKPENVATFDHNNTIGPEDAMITLTVFTDSNCLSCRSEVKHLIRIVKSNPGLVRLVLKFAPAVSSETNGGIFDQIARREGVFPAYFKAVLKEKEVLDIDQFLVLLDKLNVPLENLRSVMQQDMNSILRDMQRDINQGDRLRVSNMNLPVVYLNGYRVGQNYLPQENLSEIIRLIIKGQFSFTE